MATERVAPPPLPAAEQLLQIVEEKLEQVEVAEPEKTDAAPDQEEQEVKMASTPQDKQEEEEEEEKLYSDESVAEACTDKVEEQPSLKKAEEQVKEEIVEENREKAKDKIGEQEQEDSLEASGEKLPDPEVETCEQVSKEEELVEEEAVEANPAEEYTQETEAPMAADEPTNPVVEEPKEEEEDTAEEGVVEKIETLQEIQGIQEPVPLEEAKPKGQSEVAEDPSEEIQPRESLQTLMGKEEENHDQVVEDKTAESYDTVASVEDETPAKELALVVVDVAEENRLEMDVVADGSTEQTEQVQSGNTPEPSKEVAEEPSEEIDPRESLQTLMTNEEETQDQVVEDKTTERYDTVSSVENKIQGDDKQVEEESSITEAHVEKAASEDKGNELAPVVLDAEENKLEEDVVTIGSTEQTEEVKKNDSTPEPAKDVAEKSLEVGSVSRDVELTPENMEEEVKLETQVSTPIDIEKNGKEEGQPRDIEAAEESKEEETKEEKAAEETVQETGVEESAKPEEENNIKDTDKIKDGQDQAKEESPAKPVKQSNNLISKVKHSLVKAKKAILGKSPTPNPVSTDTKG